MKGSQTVRNDILWLKKLKLELTPQWFWTLATDVRIVLDLDNTVKIEGSRSSVSVL